MKKVIVANDGTQTLAMTIVVDQGVDLDKAARAACREYCLTEDGKNVYSGNCHNFNWGDLDLYVPIEICKKHGFHIIESHNAEYRDLNEQLVDETDIFPEE